VIDRGKTEVLGESLSHYCFVQHKYVKWPGNCFNMTILFVQLQ